MQTRIIILIPANSGHRFSEDGLDNEAAKHGFSITYAEYEKCSQQTATRYADKLSRMEGAICVVCPELHSEIFLRETRCRAWGISHRNGELQESTREDEVSGLKFIQLLREKLPVIPMTMHHSGQFDDDFDIGFHGRAKDFVGTILLKLQPYGTVNAKGV